jgi:plasmid stability protein
MPDFLVRGLDQVTMKALKDRAAKNGRSLQAEIQDTLRRSVKMTREEMMESSRRLRARSGGVVHPDSTPDIREFRDTH